MTRFLTFVFNFLICILIVYIISEAQLKKKIAPDKYITFNVDNTCGNPATLHARIIILDESFLIINSIELEDKRDCQYEFSFSLADSEKVEYLGEQYYFTANEIQSFDGKNMFFEEKYIPLGDQLSTIGSLQYFVNFVALEDATSVPPKNPVLSSKSEITIKADSYKHVITSTDSEEIERNEGSYPSLFSFGMGPDTYGSFNIAPRWIVENSQSISIVLSGIMGAIISQYFNQGVYVGICQSILAFRNFFKNG